jgi:vancomycin resistance protein YoaR
LCRLENGLDATVYENDADFRFRNIQEGSVITGRVKFGDEENFSVNLVCKRERLRRHDIYIEELGLQDVPEEDMVNKSYKADEDEH